MTVRNDVTIDWTQSPRVLTVQSPSTSIAIQDLVDTCRYLEVLDFNMVYDHLVDAAGKNNLGGGVLVGVTATLFNAVLAFEANPGPTYVQCTVNGGNLVAVDSTGASISPIQPTAFTQVVTTSSSSATLQQSTEIQYASFGNAVHVDFVNGISGTTYPNGTPRQKVNNFTDAISIAVTNGFDAFTIYGNAVIDSSIDYSGYFFNGISPTKTTLMIDSTANTYGCTFTNSTVSGIVNSGTTIINSIINDLSGVDGYINSCILKGTITLSGITSSVLTMSGCSDGIPGPGAPIIDFNGSGTALDARQFSGGIEFRHKNGSDAVSIDGNFRLVLDNTVSGGSFLCRGVGKVQNKSVSGTVVDTTTLISNDSIHAQTKYFIESLRNDHSGFGSVFYWDPVNGSDVNHDGLSPDAAVLTFAKAQSLCTAGTGDVIFIVNTTGTVIINEVINITKDSLILRGPGNSLFLPLTDGYDTITISANNVAVSGFAVIGQGPTPRNAINVTGNFARIENIGIVSSSGIGIKITGNDHQINRFSINYCASTGVQLTDGYSFTITEGVINNGAGWGMDIIGTTQYSTSLVNIDQLLIHQNASGGIRIGTGAELVSITELCSIGISSIQPIRVQNNGFTTYDITLQRKQDQTNSIWDEPVSSHTVSGSLAQAIINSGMTPAQAKQLLTVFIKSL